MYFVLYSSILLFFAIGLNSFQPNEDVSITDANKYHTNKRQQEYKAKIAGGDFAYIHDFPYVAFLFPTKCGATILSTRWLLSIWHCNALELTALVGVDSIENRHSGDYKIVRSFHHRKNNWDREELFPLVLLKLDRALQFDDRIQPIAIGVEQDIKDAQLAVVAGFGATEYDKTLVTNNFLRSVKIPIATHETCIRYNAIFRSLLSGNRDRDFCAGYNSDVTDIGGKHSFCEADLGSGLVVGTGKNRRLVGVAIKSQGCGIWNYPGIYASVPFATYFLARMDPEHEMMIPNATSWI